MYCIYSGKEYDKLDMNIEHIIPISLGGCNQFTIYVSKQENSVLGSQIDGLLTRQLDISMERARRGVIGHSGTLAECRVPSELEDGSPIISTFTNEGLKLFDPKQKKIVSSEGKNRIQMRTSFDMDVRIKFVAKVALATGYYLFQDKFVKNADCELLRRVIHCPSFKDACDNDPKQFRGLRVIDSFHQESKDKLMTEAYRTYCKMVDKSNVELSFSPRSMIVQVGILGKYVGSINFPADVNCFPHEGAFDLGHVMVCTENGVRENSLRKEALLCAKALNMDVSNFSYLPKE